MKLWPVEHFCPHFFSRSALISTDLEKKWGQKCSTGQSFICTEVTSYKIHILVGILQSVTHFTYREKSYHALRIEYSCSSKMGLGMKVSIVQKWLTFYWTLNKLHIIRWLYRHQCISRGCISLRGNGHQNYVTPTFNTSKFENMPKFCK